LLLGVVAALSFWVGGGALHEFAKVDRMFAEMIGIVLGLVLGVIAVLLRALAERHRSSNREKKYPWAKPNDRKLSSIQVNCRKYCEVLTSAPIRFASTNSKMGYYRECRRSHYVLRTCIGLRREARHAGNTQAIATTTSSVAETVMKTVGSSGAVS
jgi:hypothetical protein